MFSIKTVFILLLVVSQVESQLRHCPACIDDDFFVFLNLNYDFFPIDYIAHIHDNDLTEFVCSKNSYTTVECNQSCVSVHVKSTRKNKTKTIGWAFDCSTDVVHDIPFKIPDAPTNLTNFDGQIRYFDHTYNSDNTYEFSFNSDPRKIQTTQEYYRNEDNHKNRVAKVETTTVIQTTHRHKDCECHKNDEMETTTQTVVIPANQKEESEFHVEGNLDTTTQLMAKPTTTTHHFLFGSCGFVLVLIMIVKFVNCSKNQNQDEELQELQSNIAFKKLDDSMEGETIIVPPVKQEEENIA